METPPTWGTAVKPDRTSGGARDVAGRVISIEETAMGKFAMWVGAAAASAVMAGGCVSTKEYENLKAQRDAAIMQRDMARVEASGLKAEADAFRNQLGAVVAEGSRKDAALTSLNNESAELRSQLAEANARYAERMDTPSQFEETSFTPGVSLPGSLQDALAAFAQKNKGVVEFDAHKGVVRFKSDATFAPGSSDLTAKGKHAAERLAAILSSKSGAGFELMVAGHTDGTPISKAATIKAGHKDNWHLSAHRAIAVGKVLQGNHVHPKRMAMVGYADQRPVASNASDAGRAQNRRVEVLVLSSKLSAKDLAVGKPTGKKAAPKGASADAGWNK
jgi:chemotaxis protein MotB